MTGFVPDEFDAPTELRTERFVLVPLTTEHNERDHDAWMTSIDHIRSTPGWSTSRWPREMSLEDNARDLTRHANDFAARRGFTYSVLSPDEQDVIGCVYIYPKDGTVEVESWVRSTHAHLDRALFDAVTSWLTNDWPFEQFVYAPRA